MVAELKDTFFTQHGKYFSSADSKKTAALPFKDHPQFSALVDILSRKNHHHAILTIDFSTNLHSVFLEAFLHHLAYDQIPYYLRGAELIYLNLENALFTEIRQLTIEKDFESLCDSLDKTDKYLIIAFSRIELFSKEVKKSDERFLRHQIEILLSHPKCRCLLITNSKEYLQYNHLEEQFTCLQIAAPTEADIMTVLKQQRVELEAYHHVLIPEELLSQALLLVERYLSTSQTLEKAILLIDSSAARISQPSDNENQFKPVLTTATLLNVLSDWTQIPVTHLQTNTFKHVEFMQNLQQRIFGQDTAATILGHELLQAQAYLQQKKGPFCSFLFAGPAHSGKKTMAVVLTEQLFKQLNVLFYAQTPLPHQTLADIKLQRCLDKQFLSLVDVIRQIPYAIILFDNIEKFSTNILEGLQEILTTGYLHDLQGNQHNFRQSIIILNTTIGSNNLAEFAEEFIPDDDIYTMDLMQLVMSEQKQEGRDNTHHYSSQKIIEKIMPDITEAFPVSLCQHLHLVPFLPLNKTAIEKIIRLKLKALGKQLDAQYGIELGYAPEVIRYLTNEVLTKDAPNDVINPDKALKQLYFCVEQAILNQADNKNRSNQLFLQLNETGHLLRCDWLAMATVRQHTH